ncbi:Uncharacterized protein dnm_038060 [Desulfonema magnum]|uniref:Uncharacterized protein n=1 Tax=Desulfonema magnum TaxID=45655 RepID=A0A975BL86_9BACT|nr:Uncharacterized protein dnm_038060 [Desulfonema magnum]
MLTESSSGVDEFRTFPGNFPIVRQNSRRSPREQFGNIFDLLKLDHRV